jgi:uncharacterized cupin superfamily protein
VERVDAIQIDVNERRRIHTKRARARESLTRLAEHHESIVTKEQFGVCAAGRSYLRQTLHEAEGRLQELDDSGRVLVEEVGRDRLVAGRRVLHGWIMTRTMVSESRLASTDHGLVPHGDGWFVLNARDTRWFHAPGRSAICEFEGPYEGEQDFLQFGINLSVLGPGEPMAMYHWEADQEDFLVLSGEALLVVEGEERRLRQWDFVHCPPGTKHAIVGAGDAPCVVLAVGARDHATGPDWGGYSVDEAAVRHSAGVEQETTDPKQAYAGLTKREPASYREGWLPE